MLGGGSACACPAPSDPRRCCCCASGPAGPEGVGGRPFLGSHIPFLLLGAHAHPERCECVRYVSTPAGVFTGAARCSTLELPETNGEKKSRFQPKNVRTNYEGSNWLASLLRWPSTPPSRLLGWKVFPALK